MCDQPCEFVRDLLKAEFAAEGKGQRGFQQQRRSFVCLLLIHSQLEFHFFFPCYEIALIVGSDYIVKGRGWGNKAEEDWKSREPSTEKETDGQEKRQAERYRRRKKYSGEGTQQGVGTVQGVVKCMPLLKREKNRQRKKSAGWKRGSWGSVPHKQELAVAASSSDPPQQDTSSTFSPPEHLLSDRREAGIWLLGGLERFMFTWDIKALNITKQLVSGLLKRNLWNQITLEETKSNLGKVRYVSIVT